MHEDIVHIGFFNNIWKDWRYILVDFLILWTLLLWLIGNALEDLKQTLFLIPICKREKKKGIRKKNDSFQLTRNVFNVGIFELAAEESPYLYLILVPIKKNSWS